MNDIHSLVGEYVVGGLNASQTREFEAHLASCPDCREEVADMRDVAAQLSEAVASDPPPSLRASVLAQIANTLQDQPVLAHDDAAPSLPTTATPSGESRESNVIPLPRRSAAARAIGVLAAAAVVAAIVMAGWAVQSRNDARDATAQARQLAQVLTAKDVKTVPGTFGDGGGAVIVSASQGRAVLVAAGLPPLPEGKVYEAWTITNEPVPAGTFAPDGSQAVVSLPGAAVDAASVAVTVEPDGGSEHPTTDPVFAVDLRTA